MEEQKIDISNLNKLSSLGMFIFAFANIAIFFVKKTFSIHIFKFVIDAVSIVILWISFYRYSKIFRISLIKNFLLFSFFYLLADIFRIITPGMIGSFIIKNINLLKDLHINPVNLFGYTARFFLIAPMLLIIISFYFLREIFVELNSKLDCSLLIKGCNWLLVSAFFLPLNYHFSIILSVIGYAQIIKGFFKISSETEISA
jgi:hypothetical protein